VRFSYIRYTLAFGALIPCTNKRRRLGLLGIMIMTDRIWIGVLFEHKNLLNKVHVRPSRDDTSYGWVYRQEDPRGKGINKRSSTLNNPTWTASTKVYTEREEKPTSNCLLSALSPIEPLIFPRPSSCSRCMYNMLDSFRSPETSPCRSPPVDILMQMVAKKLRPRIRSDTGLLLKSFPMQIKCNNNNDNQSLSLARPLNRSLK